MCFLIGWTTLPLSGLLPWAAMYVVGDTALWVATDPVNQKRRPVLFRSLRLGATCLSTCAWMTLGLLWWFTPEPHGQAVGVGLIAGVLLYVVRGCHRSMAQMLVSGIPPVLTLLVLGIPTIVLAPIAQYFLGVKWQLFPPTAGAQPSFYALLLPGIVLGSLSLATALRLTRTSVAENLRADYVRTARSKGLVKRRIVSVHVLRNSLIPVVTFLGVELGNLMSGAIITEGVFNIPGVGFNLFRGIRTEDGPLVVGIVSVLVVVYLISNLVVDVLYAVLDPRIRYE